MNLIKNKLAPSLMAILLLSACGDVSTDVANKLNTLQNKAASLDSLINSEVDKVLALDSLINSESSKVKKLDSLINQNVSKIEAIGQ